MVNEDGLRGGEKVASAEEDGTEETSADEQGKWRNCRWQRRKEFGGMLGSDLISLLLIFFLIYRPFWSGGDGFAAATDATRRLATGPIPFLVQRCSGF